MNDQTTGDRLMNERLQTPAPKTGNLTTEQIAALSGLEFVQGISNGTLPQPPIAELLGFGPTEMEVGRVVFTAAPDERHYNPMGTVHGGIAATLLDTCMTCAVQTTLKAGLGCTTIDLTVHFTRPMTAKTGVVRAEGKVVSAGRQIATAEGRLTDANGKLIAHATTSCLIFPIRAGE
jgi:uncharacterized protein (TIGR00369 family)